MDAAQIRELSDIATLRLQNKEGTESSNKGGWLMISTILIEAWDLYAISFILLFVKAEWSGINGFGGSSHYQWWLWGLVTASTQGGAIIGAWLGGYIADQVGRKKMFITTMILFIVFALLQGFSMNIWYLMIVRFLIGIPLGADIANGYAYIMESMSKGKREIMGVRWQFMFGLGEVIAIVVVVIMYAAGMYAHPDLLWRIALALGAIPAVIVLFARLKLPETPLSLVQRGHFHEAKVASKELFDDSLDILPDEDVKIDRVKTGDFLKVIMSDDTKRRGTLYGWISNFCQGWEFSGFGLYLPVILATFLSASGAGLLSAKQAGDTSALVTNDAKPSIISWVMYSHSITQVNLITAAVYVVATISGFCAPYALKKIKHQGVGLVGFGMAFVGLLGVALFMYLQGTSKSFGVATLFLVIFLAILMWGHYWDASNGQTLVSLVAPPRFKATASGFGYIFVKLASFLGAFLFPLIAGSATTAAQHPIRATLVVSIFSLIGLLSALFILPGKINKKDDLFGYVEQETAALEAKAAA
ncbi:MAG: MFS transporter [Propionibacteriaceae bacterium]|nr:MFS transporter [Propionibacteriaceae bacterium]